jgi:outer membrane lipoprotein SlyB
LVLLEMMIQTLDAIIAREPGNADAARLFSEWRLQSVCADCGRVMAIGESTVKRAQSAYPALFGGAAGAAVGRNRADESKRDERAAKGALLGIALGSLISSASSSKRVFIVSVQMDDGRVEHVPTFAKPQLVIGDRVVRSRVADQVQLSRQVETRL